MYMITGFLIKNLNRYLLSLFCPSYRMLLQFRRSINHYVTLAKAYEDE